MGVKVMRLLLTNEWLGHPAGSVVSVREPIAQQIIARGGGKEVEDKQSKAPQEDKNLKHSTKK